MKVHFKGTDRVVEMTGTWKLAKLLSELDLNPEEVIAVKDGKILTHDQIIKEGEELEIISVVSGG